MNHSEPILIVKVSNDKKIFEIISKDEITIDDIKNNCKKEFNYTDEDIKNISIFFIDEDNDKNLINDNDMLMTYSHEIDNLKYLINLKVEINEKINVEKNNINKLEKAKTEIIIAQNSDNNIIIKEKEINNINKLKNEINVLKDKIEDYKERIKKIISYYEDILYQQKNDVEYKIDKQKSFLENVKNSKINESLFNKNDGIYLDTFKKANSEIIINKDEVNNFSFIKEKKHYKDLEFIHNLCNNCKKKGQKKIFKCPYDENFFLCQTCYNVNRQKKTKNKFHIHLDFYEITFPKEIINIIEMKKEENRKFNVSISNFYKIIKNIFFDKNGIILSKPCLDEAHTKDLIKIINEMKSYNIDPADYFGEYEKTYIKKELKNMDEDTKKIFLEKIASFYDKIYELKK